MKTLQRVLSGASFALAVSWFCAAEAALTLTVQPIQICDDAV
jgi:hypothetical protein